MSNNLTYTPAVQLLALIRFGQMSPRMFAALFQHFEGITGILEATPAALVEIPGLSKTAATKLSKARQRLTEAAAIVEELGKRDIRVLTRFDEEYGELLPELNDPPPLLYLRGKMPVPGKKSVTLVGTEAATEMGIALTTRLAKQFAEGSVQVISSLTLGNDAAAHLGARAGGGVSFAVIDVGFDAIPQVEGIPLAIDITHEGGVVSEYPPEFKEGDHTLEAADRLLVALGQAVVITEVYQESKRIHDIIDFCNQIGKMSFIMIDPEYGPLADKHSLEHALRCGFIPLQGLDKTPDIIKVLV
jgi:DNA processing protein